MPPKTPIEAINDDNFFNGAIFYFKWSQKQQPTNQYNHRRDKYWVVSHTQYQWSQHLLQNQLWCPSQCNSRKLKLCKQNQDHPKHIQWKQYTSQKTMYIRFPTLWEEKVPLFIVADTNYLPITGLNSSKQLNLIKKILSISSSQRCYFLNEYKDCFGEIGTLPKLCHLTNDQNNTCCNPSKESFNDLTR